MRTMSDAKKPKRRKPPGRNPWPKRCKDLRTRSKLTQAAAAAKVGTVLRSWQNWEYGRTRPNAAAARAIELAFGVQF